MKTILSLGAGRSSAVLISYLLQQAKENGWKILVGDLSVDAARERVGSSPAGEAIRFDVNHEEESIKSIALADVVISLLPAHFHPMVAKYCLALGKHLLTASYVSEEMNALHEDARAKGLLFLNECGLDPGIDHMSAMQVIDKIKQDGGKLTSFESFTGGLIAPETDPGNPWRYKFTWNSRNVVMAGQSTAKYIQEGEYKYIPYQQLFKRITPVNVPGYGEYEGYANRDSLKYIDTYKLTGIKTMLRGTLRNKGFCAAWDIFVQLGCCDDTYLMEGVNTMTHRSFINSFVDGDRRISLEEKLIKSFSLKSDGPEMERLRWSGLFDDELVGLNSGTPAQILEYILNKKWKLKAGDNDFIVMWHRFLYDKGNHQHEIQASLIARGEDVINTAMAKTVGLPLGIAAKLLLQGKIQSRGVVIPVFSEFYTPILQELKTLGVELTESEMN
ncbi:saccharopine dehydrogenase family protein [Ohtaekwangia koreensis]|uniref:Saccharopine dehydrogenase (NADP+, L-glutamate forming) n=1 Tax=Ohtaekwangia koreensis TaxID=688867 RepID=A0A1T5J1G5_9BACT|nr:saccharopine dehydrogenase C-terminal domain-containing protein [Ohtaekwangia koreensis]SKC45073.1 saccharopine dehydrogenase (NADP+, L-glutamate forming) [Ohtaekwangia koreensis]